MFSHPSNSRFHGCTVKETTETQQKGAVTRFHQAPLSFKEKSQILNLDLIVFIIEMFSASFFVMLAISSDMKCYCTVSTFGGSAMCALYCRPIDPLTSVNKGF